jgi:hypothetical protein
MIEKNVIKNQWLLAIRSSNNTKNIPPTAIIKDTSDSGSA